MKTTLYEGDEKCRECGDPAGVVHRYPTENLYETSWGAEAVMVGKAYYCLACALELLKYRDEDDLEWVHAAFRAEPGWVHTKL